MDRSLEDMRLAWENIPKTKKGEVVTWPGDSYVRMGLSHEPITKREMFNYTVCHKVSVDIFLISALMINVSHFSPPRPSTKTLKY